MPPVTMFYNELSAPPIDLGEGEVAAWKACTEQFLKGLYAISEIRSDFRVSVQPGQLGKVIGAKPLTAWLSQWLGTTHYRWLQTKIKAQEVSNDFVLDVYFNGQKADGLTKAHLSSSWALSFPKEGSDWVGRLIEAIDCRLNGSELIETTCSIRNISNEQHPVSWANEIRTWGHEVAEHNVIGRVEAHCVAMYPLDHSPPHVHVLAADQIYVDGRAKAFAKYRIDQFVRLEGKPDLDREMEAWIHANREALLTSWKLCQAGCHPIAIA